jgi:UDP:flavonoid glycosyltransferase YjiC (YdhE family)
MPFDGHVQPLTGLAVHLQQRGHEVRFYTGPGYAEKLARLGIPHAPFVRATDVNALNIEQHFPGYSKLGTGPKAIEFAARNIFFANIANHYRDVMELREKGYAFDAIVCDGAFYASSVLAEKLGVPTYAVWPSPTPAPTGKNVPPPFFGFRPARGPIGWLRDRIVASMVDGATKKSRPLLNDLRVAEGLAPFTDSFWNIHNRTSSALFQVGAPSLDFPRDDWPSQHVFIGALQPRRAGSASLPPALQEKIRRFPSVIVVSQGTVDNRDPEKLMAPTLEALKGGRHLVIATTGQRHTEALRARFPEDNVVVEDFVDYHALLPHADVFVSNGGHGSVLLALSYGVPVLAAGKLEGKNDINARLAYRGLGVDLRTERATPAQIDRGVARVLGDRAMHERVARFREELLAIDTFGVVEQRLARDGIAPEARAALAAG